MLCNILKFPFAVMSECGGWCRFAVLNTSLLFGPYLYSMLVCFLFIVYVCPLPHAFLRLHSLVTGAPISDDEYTSWTAIDLCPSWKEKMALVPATMIIYTLFGIVIILLIPMMITAIFPAIAYTHIFMIVVFVLGSIVAFSFIIVGGLTGCWITGTEYEDTEERVYALMYFTTMFALHGAFMSLLGFAAYFFTTSFFLYVTGDWAAFHYAFFEETFEPFPPSLPAWPDFHLALNPDVFYEVLKKLLQFEFTLPDAMLEMGILFSIFTSSLNIIIKLAVLVYSCMCKSRRRGGDASGAAGALTAFTIGASDLQL